LTPRRTLPKIRVLAKTMNSAAAVNLTLSVPCYNEAAALPFLEPRLRKALERLGVSWEVIFVNGRIPGNE